MDSNGAGRRLGELLLREHISRAEFAKKAGLTRQRVSQIVAGDLKSIDGWQRVADAAGVPISYFLDDAAPGTLDLATETRRLRERLEEFTEPRDPKTIPTYAPTEGLVLLPILGRVTCGGGGFNEEAIIGYSHFPRTFIPPGQEDACFILDVVGDSMADAGLRDGDQIVVCSGVPVHDGDIAVVDVENEAVCKRVYLRGSSVLLVSDNPEFAPREVDRARIVGRVMRATRAF